MLARIRKAQESEAGFTLIELLVVMIIIGILAAIAIPVFLNQRKSAKDASIKSDLRNIATQMESYYTNQQAYVTPGTLANNTLPIGSGGAYDAKVSGANTFVFAFNGTSGTAGSTTAFCIKGSNTGASQAWVYESDNGGLQASSVTACPASGTPSYANAAAY